MKALSDNTTAARRRLKDAEAATAGGRWAGNLLAALAGEAWRPPHVLAETLRVEERRLREFLDVLKGLGLLEAGRRGVRLSPLGEAVLREWE